MAKLNREWYRRRWILALLFILLTTVSMMGPAQALSGLQTASVTVMEKFAAMVSPDKPTAVAKPAAAASTSQWIDEILTPDFTALSFGQEPVGSVAPGVTDDPAAAIGSAASSPTTQHQAGGPGGGFGVPGRPAGGGGGSGLGGGGSAFGSPLAATDQALSQELALFDISAASPFASDPAIADSGLGAQAGGADGSTPGSGLPGSGGNGPTTGPVGGGSGLPTLDNAGGGPGSENSVLPSTPYANGTVPPIIIQDLLDELSVPTPEVPGTALNRTSAGFDLSQVPEPSTLLLISLGLAALRHRSRQGLSRR